MVFITAKQLLSLLITAALLMTQEAVKSEPTPVRFALDSPGSKLIPHSAKNEK